MPKTEAAPLTDLRPMIVRMRQGESLNCAIGAVDSNAADIALHPNRQPLALVKELKEKYAKVQKPAHGVAWIPEGKRNELNLRLGQTPVSGIARRLALRLRGIGLKKIVIFTDSDLAFDSHESADEADVDSTEDEQAQANRARALKEEVREAGAMIRTLDVALWGQAKGLLEAAIAGLNSGNEDATRAAVRDLKALRGPAQPVAGAPAVVAGAWTTARPAAAPRINALGQRQPAAAAVPENTRAALQAYLTRAKPTWAAAQAAPANMPGKAEFDLAYQHLRGSILSGAVENGLDLAKQVRKAAFKVEAGQERVSQQTQDWERMKPVLDKVRKTYFTDAAAEGLMASNLNPGEEFKAFQAAYLANSRKPTAARCDQVSAAAQAYLVHLKEDFTQGRATTPDQVKKKLLAEEAMVAARHMKMALQMDEMGPPPWEGRNAILATGIRASFDIDTAHDSDRYSVPKGGMQNPTLLRVGRTPASALKAGNANATFWIDGYEPAAADAAVAEGGENAARQPVAKAADPHHFVFKPQQGEEDLSNSDGFPKGGATAREVVTHQVSNALRDMTGLDFGVPDTSVATVAPQSVALEQFNAEMRRKWELSRIIDDTAPVMGSVQCFKSSQGPLAANRDAQNAMSPEECQKAAVLDIVTMNTDRHENNFLVGTKSAADGAATPTLIPIDHGMTLPDRDGLASRTKRRMNHPARNILLSMPGSHEPFTPEMLERIELIDPVAIQNTVNAARTNVDAAAPGVGAAATISEECGEIAGRAARFLKLACRQLSPAVVQIALASKHAELFDSTDADFPARAQQVIDLFVSTQAEIRELCTTDYIMGDFTLHNMVCQALGLEDMDTDTLRAWAFEHAELTLREVRAAEAAVKAKKAA